MLYDALENVGLEMIDFQSPDLFNDLTVLCTRLKEAISKKDVKAEFVIMDDLAKVVKRRTGMNVKGKIESGEANAYIEFIPKSRTHPLVAARNKELLGKVDIDLLLKSNIKLNIDLKNSKVTGNLSKEPPADITISDKLIAILEPDESAAIILHELGHLFFYYAFLAVGAVTNAVLSEVTAFYQGNPTKEQKISLLKTIEKTTSTRFQNINEMADADPGTVVAVVSASSIDEIRKDLGTKFYDSRLNEAMADRFAVRHGAGRQLATGVDKLFRSDSFDKDDHYVSSGLTFVANAAKLTMHGLLGGVGSAALGKSLVVGAAASVASSVAFSVLLGFALATAWGFNDTYDAIPDRYKAIRREMVAALKNRNLTKEMRAQLVADIETIDAVISKLSLGIGPQIAATAGEFLQSYFSGRHTEFKFNRQLEALANNDLFLAASKLTL